MGGAALRGRGSGPALQLAGRGVVCAPWAGVPLSNEEGLHLPAGSGLAVQGA